MTLRRALGLLMLAAAGAAVLHAARAALPAPPLAEPGSLYDWWTAHGTAAAALSLVRIGGLAFCCYLVLIGLLGTITALTRWRWLLALTVWAATPALRRAVVGGGLAVALSSGNIAAAAVPALYSVTDVGAVPADQDALADIEGGGLADAARYAVADVGAAPAGLDPFGEARGAVPRDASLRAAAGAGTAPAGLDLGGDARGAAPPAASLRAAAGAGAAPADFAVSDTGAARQAGATLHSVSDVGAAHDGDEARRGLRAAAADDGVRSRRPSVPVRAVATAAAADARPQGADDRFDAAAQARLAAARAVAAADTWLVERGDHLWGIAADTVAERTGADDHMSVLRYWLRLIEDNADTVGDNPDLIHPGQLIRLPR